MPYLPLQALIENPELRRLHFDAIAMASEAIKDMPRDLRRVYKFCEVYDNVIKKGLEENYEQ